MHQGQVAMAEDRRTLSKLRCLPVPELSRETCGHQTAAHELQHEPGPLVQDTEQIERNRPARRGVGLWLGAGAHSSPSLGPGVQSVPSSCPPLHPCQKSNEHRWVGCLPGEKTLRPAQALDTIRMSSSLGAKVKEQKPKPKEQKSFAQSDQRVYMSQMLKSHHAS